jgi:hypothetical protein
MVFALAASARSTLAVIWRETKSWWWLAFTFFYMTALAYIGASAVPRSAEMIVGWTMAEWQQIAVMVSIIVSGGGLSLGRATWETWFGSKAEKQWLKRLIENDCSQTL